VLCEPDEFTLFEHRALLAAMSRRLGAVGLSPLQAFHAFNVSRSGLMGCSELYSALRWLDMAATVPQVPSPPPALARSCALRCIAGPGILYRSSLTHNHALTKPTPRLLELPRPVSSAIPPFSKAHQTKPPSRTPPRPVCRCTRRCAGSTLTPTGCSCATTLLPAAKAPRPTRRAPFWAVVSPVQDLVIPLQRIPELFPRRAKGPSRTLTREELAHFGISVKPASGFVRVARVQRPGAAKPLTIWQPVERGLTSGRAVVVLGHHASTAPDAAPARGAAMVVEIRDDKRSASSFRADASARLQAALDQVLPPPERYICIWHVGGARAALHLDRSATLQGPRRARRDRDGHGARPAAAA